MCLLPPFLSSFLPSALLSSTDSAHTYSQLLNTKFFSISPVLTTEDIQAIDDAGAKGPPRSCMLNFSGWTARPLVSRAGSLALIAGATVLGMRAYFGAGVDAL
jgi:hypothetical protein